MVCLTLQSTLLSITKAGKVYKTQSSLNTPLSEEEEHHKEKESDSNVIMFSENAFLFSNSLNIVSLNWPITTSCCFSHVADITVPPPEFS